MAPPFRGRKGNPACQGNPPSTVLLRRPLLVTFLFCAAVVIALNLVPRPLPPDPLERARALRLAGQYLAADEIYLQLLAEAPADIELNREFLDGSSMLQSTEEVRARLESHPGDAALYVEGLALITLDNEHAEALKVFERIRDQRMKYLNNTRGNAYRELAQEDRAVAAWRAEIEADGNVQGAVGNLSDHYVERKDASGIRALLEDPRTAPHVTDQRWLALREGRWLAYAGLSLQQMVVVEPVPAAAALLIAAMWILFFRRVDVFEPEPWVAMLTAFALGVLSNNLFLGPLHELADALDPGRKPELEDAIYAIAHVGLVEEIVKLLPVLVIALSTRWIDEPVDCLVYGSLSALGFATDENIGYFAQYSHSHVMILRFTVCVVAHMTWTCMVCYAWMRARYLGRSRLWIPLAFMVAVIFHGLYDYVDWTVARAMALLLALLYGRMLANGLSFSPFWSKVEQGRPGLYNEQLIWSTSLAMLLIPFLYWNFAAGTETADDWLAENCWMWFLVLVYFISIQSLALTEKRERWLVLADDLGAAPERQIDRWILLARSVLILSGATYLVAPLLPISPVWTWLGWWLLTVSMCGVFVRGAYGGEFGARACASPVEQDLRERGWQPAPLPARGRWATLLGLLGGTALGLAVLFAALYFVTEGSWQWLSAAPILIGFFLPVVWGRPNLVGAWVPPEGGTTFALLHLRGFFRKRVHPVLWSVSADGRVRHATAAEIDPGQILPARTNLHLFPGASLDELLHLHPVADCQPVSEESFPRIFSEHVKAVQRTYLAAPARRVLSCLWRFLTGDRAARPGNRSSCSASSSRPSTTPEPREAEIPPERTTG